MDNFLQDAIDRITVRISGVKAIMLRGSRQTESAVDQWSDTDLLVVLDQGVPIDERQGAAAIQAIGHVVGCEIHGSRDHSLLYRTAIACESSIQLLDLQICTYVEWVSTESRNGQSSMLVYGDIAFDRSNPAPPPENRNGFDSYNCNDIWLKYFIAVKKFARNDHLIGLHLLADLLREYLLLEMMERDNRYGTNHHRTGYGEQLPKTLDMSLLDLADKNKVYRFIRALAYEYDSRLLRHVSGYESRYDQLSAYTDQAMGT